MCVGVGLRLARRMLLSTSLLRHSASPSLQLRRSASSSSADGAQPVKPAAQPAKPAAQPEKGSTDPPKDAFRGMPSSKMPLPGLLFLFSLIMAHHAYSDLTTPPEEPIETPEERAARILSVSSDEIAQVMADGRVLLTDGSIHKL